jgi:hypothetical protein
MKENLQQDLVRELFNYDPESGELTWRVSQSNNVKVGQVAGHLTHFGYRVVGINGHIYRVHQIIWLWMTGYLPDYPKDEIDHKNTVRDDNRWENLILTDKVGNMNNELTKAKMSEVKIGNTNSKGKLIGRVWITDGTDSRMIKPDESIPSGWRAGQTRRKA